MDEVELGIKRIRNKEKYFFKYNKNNKFVSCKDLERIQKLYIPPNWTDVWISSDPNNHIQVIGIDKIGKRQYVHHSEWKKLSTFKKNINLLPFIQKLPYFIKIVNKDFNNNDYSRECIIALMFKIMIKYNIRVGNDCYVKQNNSYGLSTLLKKHIEKKKNYIYIIFKGKSNINHKIKIKERNIYDKIINLLKFKNIHLFQYITTKNELKRITSYDLNKYLQENMGYTFTCKDFRTYNANYLFIKYIQKMLKPNSLKEAKQNINYSLERTAKDLGHSKNISKKSYVIQFIPLTYLNNPNSFHNIKNINHYLEKLIKNYKKSI